MGEHPSRRRFDLVAIDLDGTLLRGTTVSQLRGAPWLPGIAETVAALRKAGMRVVVATVTWRFAAELLVEQFGFDAASGTEMAREGDVLLGRVARHFDEFDKAEFVADHCAARGIELRRCAAVGDSRSDIPLFERVGFSIALNATPRARQVADVSLQAEDARDLVALLAAT